MEGQGKEATENNDAKCSALWTRSKEKPEGEGKWKGREEMERRNWEKITKGGGREKGRGRKE